MTGIISKPSKILILLNCPAALLLLTRKSAAYPQYMLEPNVQLVQEPYRPLYLNKLMSVWQQLGAWAMPALALAAALLVLTMIIMLFRYLGLQRQSNQAFRLSEEKFRNIYTQSPIAIEIYDTDGKLIDVNPQTLELFGIEDKEHVLGFDLWTDPNISAQNVDILKNGSPVFISAFYDFDRIRAAELFPTKKVGILYVDLHVTPLIQGGETAGYLTQRIDATERQQAGIAVQENEEKFRGIYEQSPIAIQLYDSAGRLIDVNRQTLDLFGIEDMKYIIGYEMWDSPNFTPETIEAVRSGQRVNLDATLDFEQIKEHDLFPTSNSGKIYLDLHAIPLTREGKNLGYLVQLIDVTERQRMEAQLLQTQKMESIGRLAGGIAHDFNNILVPIIGYAEMGMRDLEPTDNLYYNLKRIREAADRASGLTHQILAFSRKQVLEMRVLDLNEVVTEFEVMIQRLIGEDIALQTFLAPDIYQVNADSGQIEQVLMNLAINSRDAMPTGGNLTIETAKVYLDQEYASQYADAQSPGHYVMLAVSDTGHGMDDETQQQIFEPFFTTKPLGEGTGLGLSTVFGIVKQHGGNIWVYSEPGKGTMFKIYLPSVDATAPTVENTMAEATSLYGSETILVTEDEESVREVVCETLAAYGYKVLQAHSPEEALQMATEEKGPIHLLLTDVIMPGMNGKELHQKVLAIEPSIKVLYMSGYTDNVIVHHGILHKGVNFLQKPFTIQGLAEKVRQVVSEDEL